MRIVLPVILALSVSWGLSGCGQSKDAPEKSAAESSAQMSGTAHNEHPAAGDAAMENEHPMADDTAMQNEHPMAGDTAMQNEHPHTEHPSGEHPTGN